MDLIRCVECKHFQPDPASLRMGTCLHAEPWDGSKTQFARDDHTCANYDSHGGKRDLSPEDQEKFKKSDYYT
jgi:hypothetical protein